MADWRVIDPSTLSLDRYLLLYVISTAPYDLPEFRGVEHVVYQNVAPDPAASLHGVSRSDSENPNGFVVRALMRCVQNARLWVEALEVSGRKVAVYIVNIDGQSGPVDEPLHKYREIDHSAVLVSREDFEYQVQSALYRL